MIFAQKGEMGGRENGKIIVEDEKENQVIS